MASTVKPTFKQYLPGSGRTPGGVPVQGKTRTVGRISVTSYASGGESLKPSDVGLSSIDHINLKVHEELASDDSSVRRLAAYSPSAQQFYLFIEGRTGIKDGYSDATTEEVSFVAEGDSVMDVELL